MPTTTQTVSLTGCPCCGEETECCIPLCHTIWEITIQPGDIEADLCTEEQCQQFADTWVVELTECITGQEGDPAATFEDNSGEADEVPFTPSDDCGTSGAPPTFAPLLFFHLNESFGCNVGVDIEGSGGTWAVDILDCNTAIGREYTLQPVECAVGVERCLCHAIGPITVRRIA